MSKRRPKPKKPATWRSLFLCAVSLLLGCLFMKDVLKYSLREVLGVAIVTSVLLMVGFLQNRYEAAARIIERAFRAYFLFTWSMLITLAPINLFYWLSPLILNNLPLSFQIVVFMVWGLLLILAVWLVATEKNRERVLKRLRKFSLFAPIAYSFNLLMIAILFFSSVTYVLVDHGVLKLNGPPGAQISPEVIRDFYSWHFLHAVPLLKVNETLHWKEPLTYESGWVGLILLLFQLTIIVPVIAAFAWRGKKAASRKNPRRTARVSSQPYS